MVRDKIVNFMKNFENPDYPLLGPNIKGLSFGGMWLKGPKWLNNLHIFINFFTCLFVFGEFVEAYMIRSDINKVLQNLSISVLAFVCCCKCVAFIFRLNKWSELFHSISQEEIQALQSNDKNVVNLIKEYTQYSRILTFFYWIYAFLTIVAMIVTPLFKLISSSSYRKEVKQKVIPYPEILSAWSPVDNTELHWYLFSSLVQMSMCSKCALILGIFDSTAFSIMVFLKGQMIILKGKCENIFLNCRSMDVAFDRIKECHRHHNFILRTYKYFDELLSPIMFIYVLICSISICFSVVQYVSPVATLAYKIWIVEFTSALVCQLFLFCWLSNDVLVESKKISSSVYFSDWWKVDKKLQKQILLLAGKMNVNMIFNAGPYTTLTIPTFIDILKGAYSFFTLFSQMQE